MINQAKKIGIWGIGTTGMSVIKYLAQKGQYELIALDRTPPSPEKQTFLQQHNVTFMPQEKLEEFLASIDIVVPSPGVDIGSYYSTIYNRLLPEVDLFYKEWNNRAPLIAITGTLGKTSITHIISELLHFAHKKIATGGNIGTGLCELLSQSVPDYAVIELSSFQLEYAEYIKPDIAILTNLHPKHLDRHKTMAEYFAAKNRLFINGYKQALVPLEFVHDISRVSLDNQLAAFSRSKPTDEQLGKIERAYYANGNGDIVRYFAQQEKVIVHKKYIPHFSFLDNWIIIAAALDALTVDVENLFVYAPTIQLPDHRCALVTTIDGISFYDDSKSTLIYTTNAALDIVPSNDIILLLGGISEGVNRCAEIAQLNKNKISYVVCFGAEAEQLARACMQHAILATACPTLESAMEIAHAKACAGTAILLSPAGPSYDLFTNYKERGNRFRALVHELFSAHAK